MIRQFLIGSFATSKLLSSSFGNSFDFFVRGHIAENIEDNKIAIAYNESSNPSTSTSRVTLIRYNPDDQTLSTGDDLILSQDQALSTSGYLISPAAAKISNTRLMLAGKDPRYTDNDIGIYLLDVSGDTAIELDTLRIEDIQNTGGMDISFFPETTKGVVVYHSTLDDQARAQLFDFSGDSFSLIGTEITLTSGIVGRDDRMRVVALDNEFCVVSISTIVYLFKISGTSLTEIDTAVTAGTISDKFLERLDNNTCILAYVDGTDRRYRKITTTDTTIGAGAAVLLASGYAASTEWYGHLDFISNNQFVYGISLGVSAQAGAHVVFNPQSDVVGAVNDVDLSTSDFGADHFEVVRLNNDDYAVLYQEENAVSSELTEYALKPIIVSDFTKLYGSFNATTSSITIAPQVNDLNVTGLVQEDPPTVGGTNFYVTDRLGFNADDIHQYSLSTPYDMSTASYDSASLAIGSQSNVPAGLYIFSDGDVAIVADDATDALYQYDIGTPWAISTGSYSTKSFDFSSQTDKPWDLAGKPDGTKLYLAANEPVTNQKIIYQYALSTAKDLSTSSYESKSFNLNTWVSSEPSIYIDETGTRLYVADHGGSNNYVYQFALGTAWDISTSSYVNDILLPVAINADASGIQINLDGTKLFSLDYNQQRIYQYSMSTAWDISTITSDAVSFSVGGQASQPTALFIRNA